ncbi:MAG: DUF2062 domain-containing protein [Verrucomicrobiota bacterium]
MNQALATRPMVPVARQILNLIPLEMSDSEYTCISPPHSGLLGAGFRPISMKKRYLKLVRQTFKTLRHPKLRRHTWWRALSRPLFDRNLWIPCRDTVAAGLTFGLFFSVMAMPFQSLPAAVLAMRFRANIPFAVAATWFSNPFTTPAILFGQFRLGQWMRDSLAVPMPGFLASVQFDVPGVGVLNAASFILGMITSGVLLALCAYPIVYLFSALLPHHLPVRSRRTRDAKRTPHRPQPNVTGSAPP